MNWTIAPGLVDIGPAILNYYYTTATSNDCFVAGPSGMGYLMPFNTLEEPGAPVGPCLLDPDRMKGYARLTETYLQRAGLRAVTIWDQATPMQRASYEKHCRTLYGATVQNFKDVPSVAASVEGERLRFDKLVIPYTTTFEHLKRSLTQELEHRQDNAPRFLSYQVSIWGEMKPDRMAQLCDELSRQFPDQVAFVRADHYFNLYNQAHGLPFNLALSARTRVTASSTASQTAFLTDGTPSTRWCGAETGESWVALDFGEPFQISRYVIRHAGDSGMSPAFNTRDYTVQARLEEEPWQTIHEFPGNAENVTDVEFAPVRASQVRILVTDAGSDSRARIAEVEIYGRIGPRPF